MADEDLEVLAVSAYEAFRAGAGGRLGMPPWDLIPSDARADWRAVADAVHMMMQSQDAKPAPGQAELWAQSAGGLDLPPDLRRLVAAGFEAGWAACAAKRSF